jgi:putative Mg2+ transporter-C (MgtC) family protein
VSWEVFWRIAAAAALAGLIGVEREAVGQAAGLRTHVTVAIGACLFGIVSTLGFLEFEARRELTNVQIDVTRVASNVAVGIGFLGAGLIFRRGGDVKNLTTAASLWATAAVGLAAGVGNQGAAAIGTIALLGTFILLRPIGHLVKHRIAREHRIIRIELREGADIVGVVAELKADERVTVSNMELHKRDGQPVLEVQLIGKPAADVGDVYGRIARRSDVVSVEDPLVE